MLAIDSEIERMTRDRAYAIWEAEGRPEGRAADHWLAAEMEYRSAAGGKARPSRAPRRTSASNGASAGRSPRSSATASKKKAAPKGR